MYTNTLELTKRELEVLSKIVEGKNNGIIADELCISVNTVKAHCKSIFDKLKVEDRLQAAIKALVEGIIMI